MDVLTKDTTKSNMENATTSPASSSSQQLPLISPQHITVSFTTRPFFLATIAYTISRYNTQGKYTTTRT